MRIQTNQTNPWNQFDNRFVNKGRRAGSGTSLHTRRRMLAAQDEAKETEAVKVTISAEAMELSQKLKKMERTSQLLGLEEAGETKRPEEAGEPVRLTDGELYAELVDQVQIWGDKAAKIRYQYDHQETKEMAAERAAALTQLQNLEELRRSEAGRLEKDAQKAFAAASMQQEELNRKNSELIMMLESFEDQEDEDETAGKADQDETEQKEADTAGSIMEGRIGVSAAQGELRMLDTIDRMDQSSTDRFAANDQSIKGILDERQNIYRMNAENNFTIKEKITAMSDFVGALANTADLKESFKRRIDAETDENVREKLEAMSDYFAHLDTKNQVGELTKDRAYAVQERLNARDLRLAHLGSTHLAMAQRQQEALQALYDEDDILRRQGQDGITGRAEEVAERLQEKLDERDYGDEKDNPEEEVPEQEPFEEEWESVYAEDKDRLINRTEPTSSYI